MGSRVRFLARLIISLVMLFALGLPLPAQNNTTFQYFYDDVGRLTKVVDTTGNVVSYQYDDSGNIVAITRSTLSSASTPAIFNGPVGMGRTA